MAWQISHGLAPLVLWCRGIKDRGVLGGGAMESREKVQTDNAPGLQCSNSPINELAKWSTGALAHWSTSLVLAGGGAVI